MPLDTGVALLALLISVWQLYLARRGPSCPPTVSTIKTSALTLKEKKHFIWHMFCSAARLHVSCQPVGMSRVYMLGMYNVAVPAA
jgi:hypothetical protein